MDEYKFRPAKYKKRTGHLTLMQNLALRELIDLYHLTESPPPNNVNLIAEKIGMQGEEESISVVLNEFFENTLLGWEMKGIEREIQNSKQITVLEKGGNEVAAKPKISASLLNEQALKLFEYWQIVMQSKRSRPTDKRLNLIKARLKEGYSCDDIAMAIEGCASNPHNQGHTNGTRYVGLELICRSGEKIEFYMDMIENPVLVQQKFTPNQNSQKALSTRDMTIDDELNDTSWAN